MNIKFKTKTNSKGLRDLFNSNTPNFYKFKKRNRNINIRFISVIIIIAHFLSIQLEFKIKKSF